MINARQAARTATGMALLGLLLMGAQKCDTTTSGGGGGGGGAGSQGDCTFQEVRPPSTFPAPDGSTLWITSAVIVACDPPPTSHRLVMQLQKYSGGAWVTIWIEHPDTTIPGAGGYRSVIVYNACDPGRWRLKVRITGSTKAGTPYQVDQVTTTSRITC